MIRDLSITVNDDKSITVSETSHEGERLTYIVPADAAHDWLVSNGAECGHKRVKTTTTEFTTVEFDELSPEAQAEVAEHATLTDLSADRAELVLIDERWDVLATQRAILLKDVLAEDRLGRIDAIESEMRGHVERLTVLRSLIGIERVTEEEGQTS